MIRKDFEDVMERVAQVWAPVSEEEARVWWSVMKRHQLSDVTQQLDHYIASESARFRPRLHNLLANIAKGEETETQHEMRTDTLRCSSPGCPRKRQYTRPARSSCWEHFEKYPPRCPWHSESGMSPEREKQITDWMIRDGLPSETPMQIKAARLRDENVQQSREANGSAGTVPAADHAAEKAGDLARDYFLAGHR